MPASARTRRHFLQLLAGAAASVPLARRASAQEASAAGPPAGTFSIQLLGTDHDNVPSVISGAGGNVVVLGNATFLKEATGQLLVNGGSPAQGADLFRWLTTGKSSPSIRYLFNTDWHHIGLNLAVAESGGQIFAHEFTKQYLAIDRYVEWQNAKHNALAPKALPTQTFTKPGKMTFAGQLIEYGPLGQAHTDGDIYVFFRDSNMLVAGDVMTVAKYPIADYTSGGWLGGLITATKTLLDLAGPDTIIVPGDGPLQKRTDLQAQYDMLSVSRDALVKMMRQGMSADEMLAAGATKAFDAKWGNPQLFVKTSYRGLWLHVREVGGIV
jgi:glyoxylase-like metal-dependent hydrolase (beta-lactamase superfamily II)